MRRQPLKPRIRLSAHVKPAAFPRAIPHPPPAFGPVQPPALHLAGELLAALQAPLDRRRGLRLRARRALKALKDALPSASPHVHRRRLKCVVKRLRGRRPLWAGARRRPDRRTVPSEGQRSASRRPPAQASMAGRPCRSRARRRDAGKIGALLLHVEQFPRGGHCGVACEVSSIATHLSTSIRMRRFSSTVQSISNRLI
jgi:hypothetical protein